MCAFTCEYVYVCIYPYVYVFRYSQSHLGCDFWGLEAQSSNVSFATFQWKEAFELWVSSFVGAFGGVTPGEIGCICTCIYVYVCVWVCIYIYICKCVYIYIYVDAWVCVCVYIYICVCMRVLVYLDIRKSICVYMCEYIGCMCIYMHVYICVSMYRLVHCVTLWAGRSPTSPYLWQGISYSSLRACYCCLPSTSGTLVHPILAHLLLTNNQQQGHESNKLAFCSSLTTSTLVPNPITTDSYFLTLNGPASNTYAKIT